MSIADGVAGPAGATETVSSGAVPSAAPAIAIPISGERELRLDLFRGLALWLIFIDHLPASLLTWLTIRNYGFSDATEIFIFISGYTAAFVYGRAMLEGGYEIYMVADASGGTSKEAHEYAMQRMIQAGVVPVTWQQVLLEWQRDWARREPYDAVMDVVREHSGAYGMGVDYAYTMVHKAPQRTNGSHEILPAVPAR